jgi:hypothetical protein
MEVTRRTGTSKTSVWRWQERFLAEGVPGLLRDKTRPALIPPLGIEVEARVVAATQTAAPGGKGICFPANDLTASGSQKSPNVRFGVANCRRLQQNPSRGLLDRRGIATKPGLADVTPFTGIERRPAVHGVEGPAM